MSRARRGDRDAFGSLVLAYQDIAFRTAYLVLGDAAEAQDAAQEGFVKAYSALGRFRSDAPFRPWLLQIVANSARNRRRTVGRRASLRLRAEAEPRPHSVPSAESEALAAEARSQLLAAVNGLSSDDRLIIGARYFLDLSEAEIATLIGSARGTVKSRLSRARARLAQQLAESGSEGWTDV